MGNQVERYKHSKRLHREEAAIKKQKKIAKLAGDPDEIEAEDLAALRAGKK